MIRRLIHYYAPYKWLTALDFSSAVLHSTFALAIPYFTTDMLKNDIQGGDVHKVAVKIGLLMLLIAVSAFTHYINIKWGHILGARIETDMRQDLFRHLQKLSFSYYDRTKTGHLISRIANDLLNISELAHHGPEDFIISLTFLIGAMIAMFYMNPLLAAVSVVPLICLLAWGMIMGTRMRSGFRAMRKRIADINSNVENALQGIREVQSYANEKHQINKFEEVNGLFCQAKEHMYSQMGMFASGMMFLMESYQFIVIGGGILLMMYGKIQWAEVIGFMLFTRLTMMPVRRLTDFIEQYQQGMASIERFFEVMDEQPDIVDHENAIRPEKVDGEIRIENLSFKYDTSADWILKDISLSVPAGKTAALVGESGAGKSTLASLIPRFYEAVEGSITIDGNDVKMLQQEFLRESIGIVQQNVFMFDTTIRENIEFGCPGATEEQIIEAARNANILDFIQSLPQGLDTTVGEQGVKLSGGQKQRLSIARVFLKNPAILIFDEATSSLDNESEALIKSAMEVLCKGRTTIVIAHRLSTVRNADMTYVLRGGRLVEQGRHEELVALNGYYAELYEKSKF